MHLIRDIYAARSDHERPVISFEFFPPKTEEGDRVLMERVVPELLQTRPDYCSVTYGAGGSTRDKTLGIVDRIQKRHSLPTVAHLTCVNSTQAEIADLLDQIRALGVHNVLALRGDPPGGGVFASVPGGFEYSHQLVRFIRGRLGKEISVGVAGFPEGHPACKDGKLRDWDYLKQKVEAGADFVLTQLFFDNADFYEFRDHVQKRLGVSVPIVPGIVSILSASQILRFTAVCGARIPDPLGARLKALASDDAAATEFGVDYATAQCADLIRSGVPGLHFYTLNKSRSTVRVLKNLSLA
jgi:methylenetetrahydrofolate reductase (NADPH)